jgi:putative transposase
LNVWLNCTTGQKLRSATRWDQFVAILMSQLSCRQSLRDIQSNLESQQEKLYHLGAKRIARSTLRLNEEQPASLYQQLFTQLLQRCENSKTAHKFRFKIRCIH